MRIAFFGGSFDPPHRGHVAIARAAADTFRLEKVLFAPTAQQPLKPGGAHASFVERLEMVGLVCRLDGRFSPSSVDGPRPDSSANYTVDALAKLRMMYPAADIFSLIGADSFLEFDRWYKAEQLRQLSEWIVISRPGFALGENSRAGALSTNGVHLLTTVSEDVSATEIRRRLSGGDRCTDVLSAEVSEYVVRFGLYGFPNTDDD